MRIITLLKSSVAAGLAIFLLSGCSSSSTATGLGLDVGGFWRGTLSGNGRVVATFTMSLAQASGGDDPFAASALTGTFNSNSTCVGSGQVSGSIGGNSITLAIETFNGTLNMTGTTSNTSMSGSWVFGGSITNEGVGEAASTETSCNSGGTWSAGR